MFLFADQHSRPITTRSKNVILAVSLAVLILIPIFVYRMSRVDTTISDQDRVYIRKLGDLYGFEAVPKARSFAEEIDFISKVQSAILDRVSENEGVPFDSNRDPARLFEGRSGLCYDRSWFIEKTLTVAGFRTRHVFLYSRNQEDFIPILQLFRRRSPTHALTEVMTSKGWLLVGSSKPWISLTAQGDPIKTKDLLYGYNNPAHQWDERFAHYEADILKSPAGYIIGLYSRHGKFYPPYFPLPDIEYSQLLQNLRE